MSRFLAINLLSKVLLSLTIFVTTITGSEDAIFEEDDINGLFFPPPPPLPIILVPGTKWCGIGNVAASYDDLGSERETDMCCRDHDHCGDILKPMSTLHGLNSNWLPVFNCSCEQKFMNCLKTVDDKISNTLGRLYYSARKHCMAENYPISNCKQYQPGTLRNRCIRYNMDAEKPKIWQLYDMPFYARKA